MPTYQYKCNAASQCKGCGSEVNNEGVFEVIHSISEDAWKVCPYCLKDGVESSLKRLINFQKNSLTRVFGVEEERARADSEMKEFQRLYKNDENFRANLVGESNYQSTITQKEKDMKSLDRRERQILRGKGF